MGAVFVTAQCTVSADKNVKHSHCFVQSLHITQRCLLTGIAIETAEARGKSGKGLCFACVLIDGRMALLWQQTEKVEVVY